MWILIETSKDTKCYPAHTIYQKITSEVAENLLGFHAVTGCHAVSSVAGHGKKQGRIKVRGGPRLDTVMGPYPFSFFVKLRYHRLRTPSFWGIATGKFKIANARI